MDHISKVVNLILAQPQIHGNDILYALSKINISAVDVARACDVEPAMVSRVVHGKGKSADVAFYIAMKLNTTTRRLWGDAYDYNPRISKATNQKTNQQPASACAS